jgi:hypothetical protein
MSEKHLTELQWKPFALKHKIKETKLAKALADLGKCDEKDAEARIKVLAVIEKEAVELKREQKANKEVETYLIEMLKEVEKSQNAAELLKKTPKVKPLEKAKPEEAKPKEQNKGAEEKEEKGKEEKEAPEPKKKEEAGDAIPAGVNLKSLLTGAMAKVKARKPTDPPMGAMLCQMGDQFGVLLSGNVGSGQQNVLKQVLKGTGHKFAKGTCEWGTGDIYTFILQSPLSGAARGLKLFFQKYTGVIYKLRVGAPGAMEEEVTEVKKAPESAAGTKPQVEAKPQAGSEAKPAPTTPTGTTAPTLSTYVKAKKEWKAAKAAAEKGIASLKSAILQQCDPELEAPVKAKIDVWDGILGVVDDSILIPLIDAAIKETEPDRQAGQNQKLAATVAKVTAALQQHSLASVADSNPFGKFYIRAPLNLMLSRLGESFGASA